MNLQILVRGSVITGATGLLMAANVVQAASGVLSVTPSSLTVATGATVTVDFREDSASTPVNAVQLNLTYPADKLDVVSVDGSGSAFGIKAQETRGNGSIVVARGSLKAVSGSQEVTRVTLRGKSSGNAAVMLASGSALVSSDNNANVLSTAVGSTVVSMSVTTAGSGASKAAEDSTTQPVVKAAPAQIAPKATLTPGDVPSSSVAPTPHQGRDLPMTGAVAAGGGIGLGSIGFAGVMWYRRRKLK